MNPWTIHRLSVFLLLMAPKRKRTPKKEFSSKKQKSVVVKQNVRQNANPTININFASSRQKPRAKQRSPVLQSRQQQQQPNPSQVNVAPVINISLADVLSNQRTPGIQPSSSQISTARTATGGNVYRSALFQERPMPTRQNLTEKIIQTDELNVKDAPGLELPSNVSVQPGDNSSQLIQKKYTPDNMEEEDFVDNIGDDEYKDAVDFSKTTTQKVFRNIDNAKIKKKDLTGTYENFSDDEYGDAYDFSETTKQEVLIDIDNAKKKKNEIQNNNGNGNEVVAVMNGKNLTKDEYFDGGPSQQTDGTETNVTDVTSQTTVDLALQTLTDIIEKLGNKAVDTIKGPPIAVVNFLKEKENRDYIIQTLRETNKFTSEIINEGFNFFDNFIKRTQQSVGVVADATNQTGEKIITTGVNLGGYGIQGTSYLFNLGAEGFFGVVKKSADKGTNAFKTLVEGVVDVVDTGVEGTTKIAGTFVDGGGEVVDRLVDNSTKVVDRTAKGVSQIAGTVVDGSANVVDRTAKGISQIANTAVEGSANVVNTGAEGASQIAVTVARGLNLAGPEMIKASSAALKTAIQESTDSGIVSVKQLDKFIKEARVEQRIKRAAKLMLNAANDTGEFVISSVALTTPQIAETLDKILNFGLDVGVKTSAASGMMIYNIRQGLTMPVGSASSSASLTSADPENETTGPFTFNRQSPTGNTNQSLVPTNQETNRLKIVQQRIPPLPAPPIETPVQQPLPALPAPPQQFPSQMPVPQTENLSEEQTFQQAKEETEKKLTNLKDIMKSLTGNTGPVTRSNEVLTPVMFKDFNNGDYYQEILLETYRRYKQNERRSASKESYYKLWNDLKEDEQYLKTLGIAPVVSHRESFEFEWSKKGIESHGDKLENMRNDYVQIMKQFEEQREREEEFEKQKQENQNLSYFSRFFSRF